MFITFSRTEKIPDVVFEITYQTVSRSNAIFISLLGLFSFVIYLPAFIKPYTRHGETREYNRTFGIVIKIYGVFLYTGLINESASRPLVKKYSYIFPFKNYRIKSIMIYDKYGQFTGFCRKEMKENLSSLDSVIKSTSRVTYNITELSGENYDIHTVLVGNVYDVGTGLFSWLSFFYPSVTEFMINIYGNDGELLNSIEMNLGESRIEAIKRHYGPDYGVVRVYIN